ncbi:MAG TPA: hypothetical protein PK829_10220 [Promineifilum sp.]|nr:hypothetical protein [Promineifilum sp.]
MRISLALLWLATLLLRPAAQAGDLTLSARAGFDGFYRNGATVPVFVSARNDGAPLEGEIRVAVDDGAGGQNVFTAPIALPTQSDKRVALYVHVPGFSGSLKVELVSDERVVATATTDSLTLVSPDTLFYGVVSADPGALAFLETVTGGRAEADVAFLDLANLPDVSIAWRALDVLIFDDVDTSRLTAGQLAALRTWVENGGHLVVTGGPGGPKTAAALADLLPVTVSGVASVAALPALEDFAGAPTTAPGPIVLTTSSLRRGEVLLEQDGRPLLAAGNLGLGRVTFLALDPKLAPLAGWAGHDALWMTIAAATPTPGPWSNGIQDSYTANAAVSAIPGLRLPSLAALLLFLLAYTLVIGPINFLVLRRLRRRELAWVTIPVLVLLFSAVTYFTSFHTRGREAVLHTLTVAQGSIEAEQVRMQSAVGFYSPRRGRFSLTLPYDATAVPFAGGAFGSVSGNVDAIVRAGDLTLRDIRNDTGQVTAFLVDSHAPRPALTGEVRLAAGGSALDVTLRNDAGATFENAVVVYGDQQVLVGDMAAGASREVSLPLTTPLGTSAGATPTPDPLFPTGIVIPNPLINDPTFILGTPDYYTDADAYTRWQLLQSLYNYSAPVAGQSPAASVTLAGWLSDSAQAIDVGDVAVTRSATTLVLLEIPLRP